MGKSDRQSEEKRSFWGRVVDSLCTVFTLRITLSVIYFILLVLLCVTQAISLFSSPVIHVINMEASHIIGAQVPFSSAWYKADIPIYGANATAQIDVKMWVTTVNINVDIPYGFLPQNISQQYRVQDVPCAEFRGFIKNMQIFSLLSIFTAFIVWVLTVSNFFTRMFLPLLWLFLWVTIAFTATAVAMMFRVLCDGACYGQVDEIPPFTSLAMPMGGFALAMICLETYLVTSLMTVFL
ncbi:Amastin surface glycoprotein [Novymonas esmeraldas]|uniref:Amastin surface glycoprotein n=1 Tax=Novymonas esmeraldas TaxID=1808958 RepID=A0AAW0F260_9TRYP